MKRFLGHVSLASLVFLFVLLVACGHDKSSTPKEDVLPEYENMQELNAHKCGISSFGPVVDYMPSPVDIEHITGTNPKTGEEETRQTADNAPFAGMAFKIMDDKFVGSLTFFRVYSGVLRAGSYVLNSRTGKKERIGRIVRMHANNRTDVEEVYAGDIAAIVGLKDTITGDTLCTTEALHCTLGIDVQSIIPHDIIIGLLQKLVSFFIPSFK